MSKPGRRKAPSRPPRRLPGGFFSLERRVLTEDMRGDLAMFGIWATLIGWANIADGKEKIGGQQVIVRRGQVATGIDDLADEWGLSRSTVQRCLAYLQKTGRISRQSDTHGSLITVINYDYYQSRGRKSVGDSSHDEYTVDTPSIHDRATADTIRTREQGNKENKGTREGFAAGDESPPHPAEVELFPEAEPAKVTTVKKKRERKSVPAGANVSKSGPTVEAFRTAYFAQHRAELPEGANAQMNAQACRLVDLVGAGVAPALAEYYVLNEREAWIVKARHPFGELLKNWQKYYTNWKTGTKVTGTAARAVERDDANRDAINQHLARKYGSQIGG